MAIIPTVLMSLVVMLLSACTVQPLRPKTELTPDQSGTTRR